jgi:YcxB-like protein
MTEFSETLVVDVDLQEWDLQRASLWFRLGKWSTRLLLVFLLLVGLLLLSRVDLSTIFQNPPGATLVIVLILFPVLYPVIIWFQTKRGFRNLQGFQTKIQYAFSPAGYKVSDVKSSSDIDWDTILRAAESKHSFHLFFHRSLFHTIPKRCFKRSEDITRLRALLKKKLGTKAAVG